MRTADGTERSTGKLYPVTSDVWYGCTSAYPPPERRTQDGVVVDYWANLHYVPALSTNGNLVFELREPTSNLGQCN